MAIATSCNAAMGRHECAIRGVALLTQWVKLVNTDNAYVFKALNKVHSGQLRNLGLTRLEVQTYSQIETLIRRSRIDS